HSLSSTPPHPPHTSILSLHDALPIFARGRMTGRALRGGAHEELLAALLFFGERALDERGGDEAFAQELHERVGEGALHRLVVRRSEEHTSELQSRSDLVCRLLLEKKK